MGGGVVQEVPFNYFVQDCWYVYIGNNLPGSVLKRHLHHCKGKSCETIFWRRKETKILENLCHPKFLRGFHDKSANFLSSFYAPPSLSLELRLVGVLLAKKRFRLKRLSLIEHGLNFWYHPTSFADPCRAVQVTFFACLPDPNVCPEA